MALEKADVLDAVGNEAGTGAVVLSVLDECDWTDLTAHAEALVRKIEAYVCAVLDGQLSEAYPQAAGRRVVIDVIGRFPVPAAAEAVFAKLSRFCSERMIELRRRHCPDLPS